MGRYVEVETESGTRYTFDQQTKLMRRERLAVKASDDPLVYSSEFETDGQDLPFVSFREPEIGKSLQILWNDNGRPNWRISTWVTAVREFDVPPTPDQSAGDRTRTAP